MVIDIVGCALVLVTMNVQFIYLKDVKSFTHLKHWSRREVDRLGCAGGVVFSHFISDPFALLTKNSTSLAPSFGRSGRLTKVVPVNVSVVPRTG